MADKTLKVGVLSNPLSGGNRKSLGAIREILSRSPNAVHREVRTPSDVLAGLAEYARKGVGVVGLNGGDGTIQAALTALFHHRPYATLPLLAVFRSGTTSMTAGDVGTTGSAPQGVRKLIQWSADRNRRTVLVRRPVLCVEAPGREPLYGMFFGALAVCEGIRFFHANSRGLRGEWFPGLVIARFLLGAIRRKGGRVKPSPVSIGVNGSTPERRDCLVVLASTLERLFLGMRPFWGAGKGPVRFSAVGSHPRHLLQVLPHLLRGRCGRFGTPENGYWSHNADELKLTLNSDFALDGELYTPERHLGPVILRSGGEASFLKL
jgi:diacylglycerol kinase (ATP)